MNLLKNLKSIRDYLDNWIHRLEDKQNPILYSPDSNDPRHHFRATLKTLKRNKLMVDTRDDGIYIRLAGTKYKGEAFRYEWGRVVEFNKQTTREQKLKKIL
jgi:hypothetical protein